MIRSLLATTLLLTLPALVWGGKVRVWHHHQPSHYEKAELKGVVVSSDGSLRLGRQVQPLAGIDAAHVWAIVEDKAGNLIVATGNEGKIYRVTAQGAAEVVHRSDDGQVLCLTMGPDGSVFGGTGPSGHILRIAPDGATSTFCKTGESYVWSLACNSKGELFAGTGPHGRLLRVDGEGKASVFYQTKQDHVLCTAVDGKNQVYAGTSKRGLIYRIDEQGKGFVLYDAPQSEIRSLLVTPEGVYAGTGSPSGRRTPATTAAAATSSGSISQASFPPGPSAASDKPLPDKERLATPLTPPAGGGSSSGGSSSSGPPPGKSENSVYCIHADGTVREVFREKAMVLCLHADQNCLLVGTGADGQLFEVQRRGGQRAELLRLDHTQIHCLCQRRDGTLVIGTGDPGKLYTLSAQCLQRGTVVSEVLDAKSQSRWGHMTIKGVFAGSFATRSGNTAEPDETWSGWFEECTMSPMPIQSPPARFLQYRISMGVPDSGFGTIQGSFLAVRSLSIRYQPVNGVPEISSIDVPDLDAVNLESGKKLTLRWSASDPNDDDLTYTVAYLKSGWQDWVTLESDLSKREYEWDTRTIPSGDYCVKVIASDRKDNPDKEALTAERISAPFVVDHVAPEIELKVVTNEKGKATMTASAKDGLTRLVSASYCVDSKKWQSLFPKDGLFDASVKGFEFNLSDLKPGTHVVVVRVTDAAGNTGSRDVVFRVE